MTSNVAQRMTATDLAQQFVARGLSGRWLSIGQTKFLADLAARSRGECQYSKFTWHGGWTTDSGDACSWTMYISPKNGCGLFNVQTYSAQRGRLEDEERTLLDALSAINTRCMARMEARDADGVRAILDEPESRRVGERLAEVQAALQKERGR